MKNPRCLFDIMCFSARRLAPSPMLVQRPVPAHRTCSSLHAPFCIVRSCADRPVNLPNAVARPRKDYKSSLPLTDPPFLLHLHRPPYNTPSSTTFSHLMLFSHTCPPFHAFLAPAVLSQLAYDNVIAVVAVVAVSLSHKRYGSEEGPPW
jgi:hypothetical protein